jgi:hypothetical protein
LVSSTTSPNRGAGGIGVTFTGKTVEFTPQFAAQATVVMSRDGRYIIYHTANIGSSLAGYIYVSSNYGESFTQRGGISSRYYTYMAVSSTGQYQAALVNSDGVFFSSDYGLTWANVGLASVSTWGGIYISTDGKIVIAWQGGGSTNYYITKDVVPVDGDSWSDFQIFSNVIMDLQMSANGDRVLQLYYAGSSYKVMGYKVNRSGELTNLSSSPSDPFTLTSYSGNPIISLSGDGTRIGVYGTDYSYNIVTQQISWSISDSGSLTEVGSTTTIVPTPNWYGTFIAVISSNGAVQLLSGTSSNSANGVYISYNYGVTWSTIAQSSSPSISGTQWNYLLISSDGTYINLFPAPGFSAWAQCFATSPNLTVTNIPYTPANSSNWPTALIPTTMSGALDTIAKYLNLTGSSTWSNLT